MDTLRVLVCDDEAGMRLGVERALRHFTVRVPDVDGEVHLAVEPAESAEQALEIIEAGAPEILLLDLKLPGMSGIELLERISPRHLDMLVIMISAYASIDVAVRATKQGAYNFLAKPFTPSELKDSLRQAAEHLIVARQARKLAQEKRRVRFEFISVVAHELKAPINAIEGYLKIMATHAAGDDPAVYDRMAERSITRIHGMRKMIEDLLDMTRIESGQKKREIATVDVCEVAHLALETMMPDARERNIMLEFRGPDSLPMSADRGELEIILNNLVSNAVKYNRDGGRVEVVVKNPDERVQIAVSDTGFGIAPDDAKKLFNDFVRLKNERTKGVLGSGLGLSIVKKLALLYGGDVCIDSEVDKGSTFTVELQRGDIAT
ncbi:MAG: HAMP domain-containing histidine kinase [Candidatus Hydrogenedentes bacterium]|nr:HAMP domain-containing histidine kinase [Candidatus Hydrogenedentota bacterium]